MKIISYEQKVDHLTGEPQFTEKGDAKLKVYVEGSEVPLTAYGDWVKDWVNKEYDFYTQTKSVMGNSYTVIYEPKPQPEKPLAAQFDDAVAKAAKDAAQAKTEPKWVNKDVSPSEPGADEQVPIKAPEAPVDWRDAKAKENLGMMKMSALKAAAEAYDANLAALGKSDDVLVLAEKFLEWLTNGH